MGSLLSTFRRLLNKRIVMKQLNYIFLFGVIGLSACAAVYTDASDSNHVTFLVSDGESVASLTPKANAYCAQYGKTASFRKSDTQLLAVFDCQWPQSKPR
jgi:putative hemolysin